MMLIWKDESIRGTRYKGSIVRGEIHCYHRMVTGGDPSGEEERRKNDVDLVQRSITNRERIHAVR